MKPFVCRHFRSPQFDRFCSPVGIFTLLLVVSGAFLGCDAKPEGSPTAPEGKPKAIAERAEPNIDLTVPVDGLLTARLTEEQLDFGWIRLFDGHTLFGWKPASKANWSVVDGTLAVDSGEKGFLFTTSRFSDFELQLEFLADAKTNSGIFLRCPLNPTSPAKDCFELNIAPPDDPFPTGSLVARMKVDAESVGELDPAEWHSLHALVEADTVRIWVDGREAGEYRDPTHLTSGYIGLQFREGRVQFRDVRVRPITYPVLPAKDTQDWKVSNGEGFNATLREDGAFELKGGKGYVELLQSHGDFCLQARVQTMAEKVNSGIFFRCIPGEEMNGYECQVHHGFTADRRLPIDSGSGAIFRRQAARAVLSDEGKPTHLTLIADGNHFATWVEGIQVVDWTDERAEDENPRKGKRLEAGTIQLQSHDATCHVVFESLGISPIQ